MQAAPSTAIVLHELATDQPADHRLQDRIDISTAQAHPAAFASTEDTVVLEVVAADSGTTAQESDEEDWTAGEEVLVTLLLDDGNLVDVDGRLLARRSAWFARALGLGAQATSFVEASTHEFDFRGNPHVAAATVRALLAWAAEGDATLSALPGQQLVDALQLASYLEVPRLLAAVERRLIDAIDADNALAFLALADATGARRLFGAAAEPALDALDALDTLPAGVAPSGWDETPADIREFLHERRRLRRAARELGLADDALPDAREFVSMLREATLHQRERAAEAAEWAARSEGQLRLKLAQRVARGEVSQQAAEAIFQRDTAKPRAALRAQNARLEAEARRLHEGITTRIIDDWLAARRAPPCGDPIEAIAELDTSQAVGS